MKNMNDIADQLLRETISDAVSNDLIANYSHNDVMGDTITALMHLIEATAKADNMADRDAACTYLHQYNEDVRTALITEMMPIAHDVLFSLDPEVAPGEDVITLDTAEKAMNALTVLHLMALNTEWDDLQFAKTVCTVGFDKLHEVATVLDLICYGVSDDE